jgi:hypothetical protein
VEGISPTVKVATTVATMVASPPPPPPPRCAAASSSMCGGLLLLDVVREGRGDGLLRRRGGAVPACREVDDGAAAPAC